MCFLGCGGGCRGEGGVPSDGGQVAEESGPAGEGATENESRHGTERLRDLPLPEGDCPAGVSFIVAAIVVHTVHNLAQTSA